MKYGERDSITVCMRQSLLEKGAALVGVADLTELAPDVRENLPLGISVAVKYPNDAIQSISTLPTQLYYTWYNRLNEQLDALVTEGAQELRALGFEAVALTRAHIGEWREDISTLLPYKTIAVQAGLGWIGKSALLVTEQYGSMIRLSGILTNAPLEPDEPTKASRCGSCTLCTEACPGGAILGALWQPGTPREELFDAVTCRDTAKARALQGFGEDATLCGKCIEVCPYTRSVWRT